MDYKVVLTFDAFDCESPREAAEQIELHLKEAFDRFTYEVTDKLDKTTLVDLDNNYELSDSSK